MVDKKVGRQERMERKMDDKLATSPLLVATNEDIRDEMHRIVLANPKFMDYIRRNLEKETQMMILGPKENMERAQGRCQVWSGLLSTLEKASNTTYPPQ